jgi:hypothetical protein
MKYYRICDDYDYPHPGKTVYCFSDAKEFSRYVQDMVHQSPYDSQLKFFEISGNFVDYDESNLEDESDVIVYVVSSKELKMEQVKALNPRRERGTGRRGK